MSSQYEPTSLAQGIIQPITDAELYRKNNYSSAPTFVAGVYYSYNSGTNEYSVLNSAPGDWSTNYNDYYINVESTYTDPNLHRRVMGDEYVKNNFPHPVSFISGIYYAYDDVSDKYEVLTEEPNDWSADYNDYYRLMVYEQNDFPSAINFVSGVFYSYSSNYGRYSPVYIEPNNWKTTYNTYYHRSMVIVEVCGTNSYRTLQTIYHNEESVGSEIP